MKNKSFYDGDQANMYLTNSLIRLKGEPIYIQGVRSHNRGLYIRYYIPSQQNSNDINEIDIDHNDINMNPVPLGFVNIKIPYERRSQIIDVFRKPIRGYRIGLCRNNIDYKKIFGETQDYDTRNILISRELMNTIKGKYPQYEEAFNFTVKSLGRSRAFSRRFGIQNMGDNHHLIYSKLHNPVGMCTKREPILFDQFKYLQEALTEIMR